MSNLTKEQQEVIDNLIECAQYYTYAKHFPNDETDALKDLSEAKRRMVDMIEELNNTIDD